jgi:CRISPR-associated protein Csx16
MTTWLVTRHPGALAWLLEQGFSDVRHVPHLVIEQVQPGDAVVGTLPVHLAAAACRRGARYLHLALDVPPHLRGVELDPVQMRACNARLEEYRIDAVVP